MLLVTLQSLPARERNAALFHSAQQRGFRCFLPKLPTATGWVEGGQCGTASSNHRCRQQQGQTTIYTHRCNGADGWIYSRLPWVTLSLYSTRWKFYSWETCVFLSLLWTAYKFRYSGDLITNSSTNVLQTLFKLQASYESLIVRDDVFRRKLRWKHRSKLFMWSGFLYSPSVLIY